jgi:hypothetical protein
MSQHDCTTSETMQSQEASPLQQLSVVGIDMAQQVCHLVGMDEHKARHGFLYIYAECSRLCLEGLPQSL